MVQTHTGAPCDARLLHAVVAVHMYLRKRREHFRGTDGPFCLHSIARDARARCRRNGRLHRVEAHAERVETAVCPGCDDVGWTDKDGGHQRRFRKDPENPPAGFWGCRVPKAAE